MNNGFDNENFQNNTEGTESLNSVPLSVNENNSVNNENVQPTQTVVDNSQVDSGILAAQKIQENIQNIINNATQNIENSQQEQVRVVKTDEGSKDGQNKCPKCGATEITLNVVNGKLRCGFCRHEFEPEKVEGMEEDISKLSGMVMGSGASNIAADVSEVMTFKCSSCGAEVVVDTKSSMNARCHWCRSILSVNQQIPNGAVPDVVLPFSVKKQEAQACIETFVGKRKFFANPKFKAEFTTNNIMGVYFPYMVIDMNTHANLYGQGEHLVRRYTVKHGDRTETYYDADLYEVGREFDLTINGLTVESSLDKLNTKDKSKTTNIINAIMPFDIENSVKYNANYLAGFTSEKRDTNIDDLKPLVQTQAKDIARNSANETIKYYDRGVKWEREVMDIKGEQWKAAYLPVWLYSYQEKKGDKSLLHYVAVNARTKETMGSVPIHMPKLLIVSAIIELIGLILMLFVLPNENWRYLCLTFGVIYYCVMYARYRNAGARNTYERETKRNMTDVKALDNFIRHEYRLDNSRMSGANNNSVNGSTVDKSLLEKIKQQ